MHEADALSLEDVQQAAHFIEGRVVRTPVIRSPELDAIAGVEVFLKAENMQRIGAFKARGAMNAVGRLPEAERARGVITYSSGNHAQAVALAARAYGVGCEVTMPEDAPAIKVEAVRALGAGVTFAGTTSDQRKEAAERIAERSGAVIVPPFDHRDIVLGQGTATLELCDDAERAGGPLDALYVPVGGGGLIAGACLVARERGVAVVSVEPKGCDAMAQSLEAGTRVPVAPAPTLADGLKPVRVGELNFAIVRQTVKRWHRVDDDAIGRALVTLLLRAHVLVEPSGAAALAAVLSEPLPEGARRIGVILSGGNIGPEQLRGLLERYSAY